MAVYDSFNYDVLVVGVACGFYFGWLDVSTAEHPSDDKVTVKVDLHPNKAKQDLATAGEKIQQKVNEIRPVHTVGAESVQGRLMAINLVTGKVTVQNPDGVTTVLDTTKTTQVKRGEKQIELRDLQEGEQAMVMFHLEKDKRVAEVIQVDPN